jgi:hypothetical protein
MRSLQKRNARRKSRMIKLALKYFDWRAAIIFIAAHFLTVGIYDLLVIGDEFIIPKGGFTMHMLQAAVFLSILLLNVKFELAIAAAATALVYALMAISWACTARWDSTFIQNYFYEVFPSIIMTINSIVICLLGKDGAIHLFNIFSKRTGFLNKIQLHFRGTSSNSVHNINAPICGKNFKSEKVGK